MGEEKKVDDDFADFIDVQIKFKITVRDNGIGISELNQKKLFSNFGKLAETKRENRTGVGLGLTISRDLVHAFGGDIKINSEEGKGTDFIITLCTNTKISRDEYSKAMKEQT